MDLEQHIKNLKDYIRIDKDNINYDDSDFAQFCKSHCEDIQAVLDELENQKELIKDCDEKYSRLYKFHNNQCITKDFVKEIVKDLINVYFEEDGYCFSGFMFEDKYNILNIKEDMTTMQFLTYILEILNKE